MNHDEMEYELHEQIKHERMITLHIDLLEAAALLQYCTPSRCSLLQRLQF